jgi:hypothetical protein
MLRRRAGIQDFQTGDFVRERKRALGFFPLKDETVSSTINTLTPAGEERIMLLPLAFNISSCC